MITDNTISPRAIFPKSGSDSVREIHRPVTNNSSELLSFLTLTYSMIIVLANWFDSRLINIFGLNTDAGSLIFPFTFLLATLITEIYGYKRARRAIWYGFIFNVIFIIYSQIVIHLPNPAYPTNNAIFDNLLTTNMRIIVASSISYFCAEPLNAFISAKLKVRMQGKYMAIRYILSTLIASGVDSVIFGLIAFYAVISNQDLTSLIFTMWFIKGFVQIGFMPIYLTLARKIKKIEHSDIYDTKTKYNILNLDTKYALKDNKYKDKDKEKDNKYKNLENKNKIAALQPSM